MKKRIKKVLKKVPIKNRYIGELQDIFIYCNEKTYTGKGFLFKCCEGCKHNPILKMKNFLNREIKLHHVMLVSMVGFILLWIIIAFAGVKFISYVV